jgi:hypothetical protein
MSCSKTGKPIVVNDSVVFYADVYTCKLCGNSTVPIDTDWMEATGKENNPIKVMET